MALAGMGEERSIFLFLMINNYTFEGQFLLMAELRQVSGNKLSKEGFTYLGEAFSTQLWNISLVV